MNVAAIPPVATDRNVVPRGAPARAGALDAPNDGEVFALGLGDGSGGSAEGVRVEKRVAEVLRCGQC